MFIVYSLPGSSVPTDPAKPSPSRVLFLVPGLVPVYSLVSRCWPHHLHHLPRALVWPAVLSVLMTSPRPRSGRLGPTRPPDLAPAHLDAVPDLHHVLGKSRSRSGSARPPDLAPAHLDAVPDLHHVLGKNRSGSVQPPARSPRSPRRGVTAVHHPVHHRLVHLPAPIRVPVLPQAVARSVEKNSVFK